MFSKKNVIIKEKNKKILPMILIIMDGWGIAKANEGNAIFLAKTDNINKLEKEYPSTHLCAHGKCVGLPDGQDGNSEAGHMNIGAGRIIEQDAVRISKSINIGEFFKNPALLNAVRHVKNNNSSIHLMGMLSNGKSAHSDPDHVLALIELIKKHGIKNVYLHLFTDGRDSPKYVSLKLIENINKILKNGEKIVTVMGRFYAMDRKKKWERTEMAYNALVSGDGRKAENIQKAITESYNRGNNDEFIEPCIVGNKIKETRISDNDSVIFFNLRSDRARQLAKVFTQDNFSQKNKGSFKRKKKIKNLRFIAMTDFGPDLDNIFTAFTALDLKDTLPVVLGNSLKQLYITETEKYAHVTYFFNGGYAKKVDDEDYFIVSSPDVKYYEETPTMKSEKLTEIVIKNLKEKKYDFTVLNFAAPDMIGHTGNLQAGIECCKFIDKCIIKIVKEYLKKDGTILITSDHGNVEEMINIETGEIDTEHSTNPVPFILVNDYLKNKIKLNKVGSLVDISSTILDLLKIDKPKAMTGKSLIKKL